MAQEDQLPTPEQLEHNEFEGLACEIREESGTQEECNDLSRNQLYGSMEQSLDLLSESEMEYAEVESGKTLFHYISELQSRNDAFLNFPVRDFVVEYQSEYRFLQDGVVSEEFSIYEGQIVWLDFQNGRPRVVVQGFEEKRELSLRVESTFEEILDYFSLTGRNPAEISVRIMDSAERHPLNSPDLGLEPGMTLVRRGNELIVESMPEVRRTEEVQRINGGPYETWRQLVERGFSGDYNDFFRNVETTRDGGNTFTDFKDLTGPVPENVWKVGNTLYLETLSPIVTEPTWRSVLAGLKIDYNSFPVLKAEEVGSGERFYIDERGGGPAASLPNEPIRTSFDPISRTIYWERVSGPVSLPQPERMAPPTQTEEISEYTGPMPPTPRLKPRRPELNTQTTDAIRLAAIYVGDIPVISDLVGNDNTEITPQNRTSLLANAIENLSADEYIAFRRKYGASRTLASFFDRYGLDSLDRLEVLQSAINTAVENLSSTRELQVVDAFGGKEGMKVALMQLAHHETASGFDTENNPLINGFTFSQTYCQGYFQMNWANTQYFEVNPFDADDSTRAVIELMVQNMTIYHQKKTEYESYVTEHSLNDNLDVFLMAAHNAGWLSGFTGVKTGDTLNPDPHIFPSLVMGEPAFEEFFPKGV